MKKGAVIGIVMVIIIISAGFFLLNYAHKESINRTMETVCADHNTPEKCSSYTECGWISNESKCSLMNITRDDEELNQTPEENNTSGNILNSLSNSICNQLPTSSEFDLEDDDNYYCLAVVNRNTSFCEEINKDDAGMPDPYETPEDLNDKTPFNICWAISGRDSSYCKKTSKEDAKKTCYNTLSQLVGDINICSEIDYDSHEKQQCYFNFVNALYWENKSEKITASDCDKVGMNGGNQDKKTCLALKERDVSLCGGNPSCLTFFPQKLSFCNGAAFKDEDECIRDRAMSTKNLSICGTISEQAGRDDCYLDFSGHLQPNITICDKIIGMQVKRGCYINAAINLAK
jgi:hypothetical protein